MKDTVLRIPPFSCVPKPRFCSKTTTREESKFKEMSLLVSKYHVGLDHETKDNWATIQTLFHPTKPAHVQQDTRMFPEGMRKGLEVENLEWMMFDDDKTLRVSLS